MNKYRGIAMLFMMIALVGLYLISTLRTMPGFIVLGIGAIPATIFLIRARMEEFH